MANTISYSPAYTIVPTYECFNRCSYCNFRTEPGKDKWLELSQARNLLRSQQNRGTLEVLLLSGEVHPNSQQRPAWFSRIYDLCVLAAEMGFFPHTNVGPLHREEMAKLRQVNVSMGLMLEQMTPKLLETVHRYAPSKIPQVRRQQLEWAGELQIPFTTGLLLGIGESEEDWWETLETIATLHCRWGHIQEVILQPHTQGTRQIWQENTFPIYQQLPEIVSKAREILPENMTIQIPPNLVLQPQILLDCLQAGARDLGGIGPTDEVNPDYPHPHRRQLQEILEPAGWQLQPRLPVYPQYDGWLPQWFRIPVSRWRERVAADCAIAEHAFDRRKNL
ncbi:7,8-didemethyl-8-hydroxy-5-deazariboflavin synthase subunit CofG [Geitlerinema sp. PCC 9228]|uniref:7,8-didemethyl-8-hydroxy-5-deazariboflavin synthase subunit CofG n=1 Tax=Geitlerinema sp. PCC 9228 TaxID=111611 RepID=UPI0008F98C5C|nr:7,8-didemethyl-8-hydroxy-5-deazariboflavin synthase subunit CofG [Geitlerinema sp. PCC 9228]